MTTTSCLEDAIVDQRLPTDFLDTVNTWYRPIASGIAAAHKDMETLIVGVQGSQGSGKSTLAEFLKILLGTEHNLSAAVLSIDDFYLTRRERERLARDVHPLLATRGVPGTHDVALALDTLHKLQALGRKQTCDIPRFDKSIDDRAASSHWDSVTGPIDIVIFEGWCVGIPPQDTSSLANCTNELETHEDPGGEWREYINRKLAQDYRQLFALLDLMVVLKAPSFECVYNWRLLQEQKLIEKLKSSAPERINKSRTMSPDEIKRFISHYQRLTEHALDSLPQHADWLLTLAEDHSVLSLRQKRPVRSIRDV